MEILIPSFPSQFILNRESFLWMGQLCYELKKIYLIDATEFYSLDAEAGAGSLALLNNPSCAIETTSC